MAAKIALSSTLAPKPALLHNNPHPVSLSASQLHSSSKTSFSHLRISAKLGGSDAEPKKGGKRKFITKQEEPEQYWQTAGEREGVNPMSTPLPYILLFGMSTPFVILAIAFANGWIKVPVR